MTSEHMNKSVFEVEKKQDYVGTYVCRLSDLGLGNPEGIPSRYADASDEELQNIAERSAERLVRPTDLTATACIDGRKTLHNADGSKAEVRLRRVGGSASNLGVAFNAEASVVDTLQPDAKLGSQIEDVDQYLKGLTGFDRSAHFGGCGGANGETPDHKAIHANPAVLGATKIFMEIPAVEDYFGVGYDDVLGERVRAAAGKTAQFLDASGWDGQKYVDGVAEENPRAVEDLEVGHDKFHGHEEDTLEIIIGDKTSSDDKKFVWNLKASKQIAEALAGQRGVEGYTQALIAEVAKHMAVADRLPSDKTPIILLQAK